MKQKKKAKPGNIELDPHEAVIIVHYELQIIEQNANGDESITERQKNQKRFASIISSYKLQRSPFHIIHTFCRIKIKSFDQGSNCEKYANAIINSSKYIHPSKLSHVVKLLEELKSRLGTSINVSQVSTNAPAEAEMVQVKDHFKEISHLTNKQLAESDVKQADVINEHRGMFLYFS